MAISYQSDTSPMYVGRLAPDAPPIWRSSIADNQWGRIPLTNTFLDIDPEDNALINPNFPSDSPWHGNGGMPSMMTAWCGACYDEINDVWWWPLQEGHGDGASNAPYKIDLSVDSPTVTLIRNPSGAIGNEGVLDDGQEVSGLYFDGRLRAIHSYNKPVFVPNDGPWLGIQGNVYKTATGGIAAPMRIDPITGEHTQMAMTPKPGTSSASSTVYDPSRHALWYLGAGLGFFSKYDIAGNSWIDYISLNQNGGGNSMVYIPGHDILLVISDAPAQPTSHLGVYDIATNTHREVLIAGSLSAGLAFEGSCRPVYVSNGDYVAVWDNSTDRTEISKLAIPADPLNDPWVASTLSVDAGNSITPSTAQVNGTFGRFFYSPNLNGFGLINAIDEEPYFFALGV